MQNIVENGSQSMDSVIGGCGEFLTGRKSLLQRGFTSKEAHGCGPDSPAQHGALTNRALVVFPLLNKSGRGYEDAFKISVLLP